jgi:recombination protein RecT
MKEIIEKFKTGADTTLLEVAEQYMGDGKKAKSFVQAVKDMFIADKDLQKCDMTSVFSAAKQVAHLGLTLGGDIDIIPRKNGGVLEARAEPNYKGFVTLALRAGIFAKANVVFEKDEFDLDLGSSAVKHKPFLRGDRGEPIGFYASLTFKDGASVVDWLGVEELNEFIQKRRLSSPAWANSFNEMGKKTILKRLLKIYMYADPTGDLSHMVNSDNAIEAEETAEKVNGRFHVLDEQIQKNKPKKTEDEEEEPEIDITQDIDPETGELKNVILV